MNLIANKITQTNVSSVKDERTKQNNKNEENTSPSEKHISLKNNTMTYSPQQLITKNQFVKCLCY